MPDGVRSITALRNCEQKAARGGNCRVGGNALWLVLLLVTPATAQLPGGRLSTIFPAGGQRGSEFSLKLVSHADLDESKVLWFSHKGINGVPATDAVTGSTEFRVNIDSRVPAGVYELRAGGLFGLSNPRLFVVGPHPERTEQEPNDLREQAGAAQVNMTLNGVIGRPGDVDWFQFQAAKGQRVLIRCIASGIDSPLSPSIDVYRSGGRRVGHARGHGNSDVLADITVKDTTDYVVRVSDVAFQGSAAHVYRLTIYTTPHVDFVLPPMVLPGTTSRVTVYGRNLPNAVDAGVESSGSKLQRLDVDITAPADPTLLAAPGTITSDKSDRDGFRWQLNETADPALLHFAVAPPTVEQEPNNDAAQAQQLSLPADVAGQFQNKGDTDVYTFPAKKGDVFHIDVHGCGLGGSIDPWFVLDQITTDAQGTEKTTRVTSQDDNGNNIGGNDFLTASSNPTYRLQVSADAVYRLQVRDRYADSRGDPALVYRLRIRRPEPDFRLVALAGRPAAAANQPLDQGAIALRRGGAYELTVLAHRRDGLTDAIEVVAEGLPDGVSCRRVWIPAGQSRATLVLTATTDAAPIHIPIRVVGRVAVRNPEHVAAIEAARKPLATAADAAATGPAQAAYDAAIRVEAKSRQIRSRAARPATIVRKVNGAASVSRISQTLVLSVLKGTAPLRAATRLADARHELVVNQSQQLLIPIELAKRNGFDQNVNITFTGQPKNVDVENKAIAKGQSNGTFRLFVQPNASPGRYTILPRAQAAVPFRRNPWKLEREQAEHATVVSRNEAASAAVKAATETKARSVAAVADLQKQVQALPQQIQGAEAVIVTRTQATGAARKAEETARAAAAVVQKRFQARSKAAAVLARALAAAAGDKDIADQHAKAQELVATGRTLYETAAARTRAAEKMVVEEQMKLTAAKSEKQRLEQAQKDYPGKIAAAQQQVQANDAAIEAAKAALATAAAAKAEADKRLKAVQAETRAQNVNVYEPVSPLVLHIRESPVTASASVPAGGNLKRGQSLTLDVKIKRTDYAGPMTLSVLVPAPVAGVVSPAVEVPSAATTAKVTVSAAADSPEGVLRNCVVRASFRAGDEFNVDIPVKVQVVK